MSKTFDINALGSSCEPSLFLIEANAGTGKTYTIERLYRHFVKNCGYKCSEILVVTFTEAATAELRGRIRADLAKAVSEAEEEENAEGINNLRMAVAAFDEAAIFTIHSFCQRALSEFAFESGVPFDCELDPEMPAMLQEVVRDFYRSRLSDTARPAVDLATLQKFAAVAMKQPKPTIEEAPDVEETYRTLCDSIRDTVPPGRKSGFKSALDRAKQAYEQGDHERLNEQIESGDFMSSAAKNNAPDLVRAITAYKSAQSNGLLLELKRFLEDPELGIEARKQRAQMMGFDDLLIRMKDAVAGDSNSHLARMLRRTYKVALVDEFQDTDPVQYEIFNKVFNVEGSQLFMIGDPKQAIYAFRGGDIYTYLDAKNSVPEEQRYTLTDNYRSSEELIDSVNSFFNVDRAFLEPSIDYNPSGFGVKDRPRLLRDGNIIEKPCKMIWCRGDGEDNAVSKSNIQWRFLAEAAEQIVKMLVDEHLSFCRGDQLERVCPGDIAVLVDTHAECAEIKRLLNERGVAAVIYKSGNVFKSQDADDLYHILSAILNPSQAREVRAALLTVWGGKSVAEIDQWMTDGVELAEISEQLREIHGVWQDHGVFRAVSRFMSAFKGLSNVAQGPESERRLSNYRQLLEILHAEEARVMLHPEGLLRFLQHKMSDSGGESEEFEERLESDRRAVTVMTIHKSKGLQFPVVVCPSLSLKSTGKGKGISFDLVHRDNGLYLPLSSEERDACAHRVQWEAMSEKIRLLYVAMTRAANYCVLLGGNVKHSTGQNAFNYLGKIRGETLDFGSATEPSLPNLGTPGADQPFGDIAEVEELMESTLGIDSGVLYQSSDKLPELEEPERCSPVESSFSVMSYSSMVMHGVGSSKAGDDESSALEGVEMALPIPDVLPRGKNMGLCMHEVFEQVDFTNPSSWNAEIERMADLNLYNLFGKDVEKRKQRMLDIFDAVVNRPLQDGFPLSSIPMSDTKREWTFYFPVPKMIDLKPFEEIGLSFTKPADKRKGFMMGFVDLIFRKGNRYYFADWKTDSLLDYSPEALKDTMVSTAYLFQAIIYGVALYEHLRLALGEQFSYEENFGGGFYFFVRGVDDQKGVYPYRPAEEEILKWRDILKSERAHS